MSDREDPDLRCRVCHQEADLNSAYCPDHGEEE